MDAEATLFQSTRPRGARLNVEFQAKLIEAVSIHAPAWGATNRAPKHCYRDAVSIHAPAWGATYFWW